ncbi:MAG: cbb3-type cytochrome oxidase assembly protein CcoS [Cyanobacteria bacterium REEB67]|nr:cbb3-type cytochrome oxidase assembly protein CcoS [Cyanobacteria bacterium REEB67]
MCPNCVLNGASLGGGIYVAFGICGLFFLIGIAGVLWAFKNGEFEDLEGVKFEMLDDGEDNRLGAEARAKIEKLRAQST